MEKDGIYTWLLTIAGVQNNAWPLIGFAVALNDYSKLRSSRSEDEEERGRPGEKLTREPSSTFNPRVNFKTRAHSQTSPRRSRAVTQMSSENDSDVPEQVSLSASKLQVIGRKKDVARELAQAKSKRKRLNRERDRQLKEQSSKQMAELIADSEEESSEDEEAGDPRLLPDHLFVAAFNQQSGPSIPKDAPPKTQQRKRKRTDPKPKDRIVG